MLFVSFQYRITSEYRSILRHHTFYLNYNFSLFGEKKRGIMWQIIFHLVVSSIRVGKGFYLEGDGRFVYYSRWWIHTCFKWYQVHIVSFSRAVTCPIEHLRFIFKSSSHCKSWWIIRSVLPLDIFKMSDFPGKMLSQRVRSEELFSHQSAQTTASRVGMWAIAGRDAAGAALMCQIIFIYVYPGLCCAKNSVQNLCYDYGKLFKVVVH